MLTWLEPDRWMPIDPIPPGPWVRIPLYAQGRIGMLSSLMTEKPRPGCKYGSD